MYGGKTNQLVQKSAIMREIALADEPNLNFRPKMEDSRHPLTRAFFIGDNFTNDMKHGIYGVLDGHGGKEVAEYIAKNFVTVHASLNSSSPSFTRTCSTSPRSW
jgi:serine/threonine protein phosphatase PrpC